jgi:hypothetical protein
MVFGTNNAEAMRIDASRNLLVGTTSSILSAVNRGNITLSGVSESIFNLGVGGAQGGYLYQTATDLALWNTKNGPLRFAANNAEKMRIDSSGNLLVGKTTSSIANIGVEAQQNGHLVATREGNSTQPTVRLNKLTNDGSILRFDKNGSEVGSIGTTASDLYIGTGDTTIRFADGVDGVIPTGTNGAQRDGAVNLGAASNRFKDLYLSGGAYLGGTGSANKLDDYEEGTFTVGYTGATVSSSYNTAYYTKIGRLVYWTHYTGSTTISSVTGDLILTGLPFTVKNAANGYSVLHTAHQTFFNNVNVVTGYHEVNVTTARFIISNSTTSATAVAGSGKLMMVSGVYMTDS